MKSDGDGTIGDVRCSELQPDNDNDSNEKQTTPDDIMIMMKFCNTLYSSSLFQNRNRLTLVFLLQLSTFSQVSKIKCIDVNVCYYEVLLNTQKLLSLQERNGRN